MTGIAKKSHCRRGHKYTDKSSRWDYRKKGGKLYRSCRICEANSARLRYKTDAETRKRKADYYARKKWLKSQEQNQILTTPFSF